MSLALINNPIVQREFFGILRTRKALVMLIAMAVASSLIVLLRWPTDGVVALSGVRSQQVFRIFAYTLLIGVLFVVPAFPAVSIVQEKNNGTLALLLNSPLSRLKILGGKLLASLMFAALLLSTTLPAAAACYSMGGIDMYSQFGLLYLVLLASVVLYTSVALLISTFAQSTDAAIRLTYGAVFSLSILVVVPFYFLQGKPGIWGQVATWMRAASPLPIIMDLVGNSAVGNLVLTENQSTLYPFLAISSVASLAIITLTISRLSHKLFDRARSKGVITDELKPVARGLRRLFFLVDPNRRKASIPFFINPVMVKEFRTRKFGRFQWLLRLVAGCAVLSLLLTIATASGVVDWGVKSIGGLMVLLQTSLVVLITPSLAAGLLSSERESGGWDLLRMTPMSPLKILRGKLLSVVWTISLILCSTLPGYLVMIYIQPTLWLQVYLVLISLLWVTIYTICISAAVGSFFKHSAAATTACYVVLIVLFMVPLLIWMGRDAPFSQRFVESVLSINPIGAALSVAETPGFKSYELVPKSWWMSGGISAVAMVILGCQTWRLSRPT